MYQNHFAVLPPHVVAKMLIQNRGADIEGFAKAIVPIQNQQDVVSRFADCLAMNTHTLADIVILVEQMINNKQFIDWN